MNLWNHIPRQPLLVLVLFLVSTLLVACAAPAAAPQAAEKVVTAIPAPTGAPTAANEQPKKGGTLNLSLGDDFVSFDPYFDINGSEIKPLLFEAPIRINSQGQFEPWLAEKFEVAKDGLSVTLHLRKGVKFHNGREVTADDIVWSVARARDESLGHHLNDRFKLSTGATKVDDYTVQVNYSQITQSALDAIANLYIYPKEAAGKIKTMPVGTGPFKFQEWTPGDQLTLVRFADYWRKGEPNIDKVVIKPIPDAQARVVNLQAGSIDALNNVPLTDIESLQKTPGINIVRQAPGFGFDAFLFNVTKPPFDNTLVRQALNYTVDREKIRKLAYHDQAITTALPLAPTSWAYPADLANHYTFDLAKAKALLTQAGYPNGFESQLTVRGTGGVALDAAQIWQEDLAKIGVKLTVVPTELPQYWPKLYASDFAVVSHATGDSSADPSGIFQGAACCRPFRNFFKITENPDWFPKYKSIIEQSEFELDQAKRKAFYHDALAIFVEQGWTIPLGWTQSSLASKDFVKGVRVDMGGHIWLNEAWLDK